MTEHDRGNERRWGQGEQGSPRDPGQGDQQGSGQNYGQDYGQHFGQGGYGYGQNTQGPNASGQTGYGGNGQPRQGQGQQDAGTTTMRSMFSSGQRGKAPRGYQRSDERLREMICERLMEDTRIDVSDVEIGVQGGRVTLEGSIDSRMAKYQVEDIIDSLGISDVQNNLRVSRNDGASAADGGRGRPEQSSQTGSSGGVSSLGLSASGSMGDRTAMGGFASGDTSADGSKKSPPSST